MGKKARRAVSPVLATLMMVAVAVAMSVIIFTWSQGYLSQTGEAASRQQAAQNIAAQSSIIIESVRFDTTNNKIYVYVRNIGSVAVQPALAVATGYPTNSGFKTSSTANYAGSPLAKGGLGTFEIDASGLQSGDVITIKVTTTAGTFAQGTYTVP